MLHAGVKVSGEGVLYQQGGEVQGPEDELLGPLGLGPGLITGQNPGPSLAGRGGLEDFIAEVEDVNPVIQLTFTWSNNLDSRSHQLNKITVSPCFYTFQFL